jgi:glycosyltransferase involved in cell wall biosynthesis
MLPCAAANIAASAAIGNSLPVPHKVIPNPYDSTLFTQPKSIPRDRDLVFVGRLVSEKGADLLLNVMAILKCASPGIRLTIIGDGPERGALENQAANLKLLNRVRFAGPLDQDQVAKELQRHKVLVVPSVYTEPFGVVALEGAACGCWVLGSDGGGLPEAIGPAGMTFRRGDLTDLCDKLMKVLNAPPENPSSAIAAHLERHQPWRIASEYLQLLKQVLRSQKAELREAQLRSDAEQVPVRRC